VIDAGVRGLTAAVALSRIDALLREHPEAAYVGLSFGTNDAYGVGTPEGFAEAERQLAERVRAAGKTPLIANVPYSPHPRLFTLVSYNDALARVVTALGLPAGPELYGPFAAHPEWHGPDQIHLSAEGNRQFARLWAEAFARLPAK
jgi:lysophospholipase L1-like esterase